MAAFNLDDHRFAHAPASLPTVVPGAYTVVLTVVPGPTVVLTVVPGPTVVLLLLLTQKTLFSP